MKFNYLYIIKKTSQIHRSHIFYVLLKGGDYGLVTLCTDVLYLSLNQYIGVIDVAGSD